MQVQRVSNTKLGVVEFDQLLRAQDPFGKPGGSLDLRGINLISPAALIQLAVVCHALAETGRHATISIDDEYVRSYLARSDFLGAVRSVAQFEPALDPALYQPYTALRGSSSLLIEVTQIKSGRALSDLLDRVVLVLRERLKYRKPDALDIGIAISEIAQNTYDHNNRMCGYLAMQVYSRDTNPFLEIAVGDYGCGIANTLARNPNNLPIRSDAQAILKATKLGTSQYADRTRGTGLYHLLRIALKHQGAVQIRSGQAVVRFRMDTGGHWAISVPPMAGVQIALTLPAKHGI
jgi:hypothetical protein